MARSSITESVKRVQAVLAQIDELTEDERNHLYDVINPLPEQPEAPVKKTRKRRKAVPVTSATTKKRGLPQEVAPTIQTPDDEPESCSQCERAADDNIHHLSAMVGYHEFQAAA